MFLFKRKKILFFSVRLTQIVVFGLLIIIFGLLSLWIGLTAGYRTDVKQGGKLAIVIDDFGLQRKGVREMLELDCKLTVAIMPFLEHTEDDAEDALENGKEIIIHIPMQATQHDTPSHLGPRPLTVNLTGEQIATWVEDATEELPEAAGANIHMGTLCSTKKQIILPLMKELHKRKLYFLDSKTSSKSICRETAANTEIAFYENDVFLEHESKTAGYVKKRLRKAMNIARTQGECIAIGHVGYEGGKVTAEAIKELLPEFEKHNVELVFLSEITPVAV